MEVGEVYAILGKRKTLRGVDDESRERLKQEYMNALGITTPPRCTPCFWRDLTHHFRYLLKQNGYYAMKNAKYIVADNSTIRPHGSSVSYFTVGSDYEETKFAQPLTDEVAEELLKRDPGLKEIILKNPDYKPAAEPAASKKAAEETGKSAEKAEKKS